jgi:hypothetical protein
MAGVVKSLKIRPQAFSPFTHKAGSLKMNTALEYSTRVVQEGGRRCKKSTLNDLVHLTPLRIPLMNPPTRMYSEEPSSRRLNCTVGSVGRPPFPHVLSLSLPSSMTGTEPRTVATLTLTVRSSTVYHSVRYHLRM